MCALKLPSVYIDPLHKYQFLSSAFIHTHVIKATQYLKISVLRNEKKMPNQINTLPKNQCNMYKDSNAYFLGLS